ncbi:membrane-targeted effector domain-containing toxin [Pseudomonas guariconensis]|uniref:membrane-targeted effector domain-containing toxin n=1 Tax=Pseudomonas guariconensis TaxID=1288410 RepID=UPI0018AC3822|nr:membrane-targeted effector domain-containing toxin [Pseudomonas guariconensis]MBF8721620.1 membrane-targeted effector domain-containing toxin [Pseudomonas guariconensis]MBF8792808.1 membrane-targeted effector domain-containing toxin [Pseudomonas monteilii]
MSLTQQQQNDRQALNQIAKQVIQACPDMRQMAREIAQALLHHHGLSTLEPDHVYFHRFHTAASSPRTFSGWQHHAKPYLSLTLPKLVMHRFTPTEQDNSDQLDVYAGFYRDGPGKGVYDEHNEVRLLPKDALDYFWQIDFSSQYHQRLATFWAQHDDDYRTLAKARFLSTLLEVRARQGDNLLARRALLVAKALAGIHGWPPTLQQLRQTTTPTGTCKVHTFDIGGYVASDVLRVVMDDGYQLLYLPGEDEALKLFASERDLYGWVLATTREPAARARFLSHFPLASHGEHDPNVGLGHLLDIMRCQWDAKHPKGLDTLDSPLTLDAFNHLRDAARQRMIEDAHFALRSNADLRKQLWVGYLRAFNQVFAPLAALDWPLALAATGAGLAETGLDIDQAINGHTTADRQEGAIAAIVAAINTLFDILMLRSAGVNDAGEMAETSTTEGEDGDAPSAQTPQDPLEPAAPEELQHWVPEAFQPSAPLQLAEAFESNVILADDASTTVHSQDGKRYVVIDDLPYQVRYAGEINTWVVIDPENPYSFTRNIPIVQDADGNWQFIERMGLKGGTPRFLLRAWGRLHPRPALPALDPLPYEIPEAQRATFERFALRGEGEWAMLDPGARVYQQLRDRMAADATRFYATFQQPPRPRIPEFSSTSGSREILQKLYEQSPGLVIGESHVEQGAKQFLIQNMQQLKNQGIRVLYLEHFMIDFQQAELDVFNRTGVLPADLKTYIEAHDARASLEPTPYTLKKVLYQAYSRNIRVQGIDCLVSYRPVWEEPPFPDARQRMMNFFAHRVIQADQARRGTTKWLALVGNTHANTFEGVPGLSELQGTLGLRVQDVEITQPRTIAPDAGFEDSFDGQTYPVTSDLLLKVPLTRPWM